jgi:hypothetical protein
MANFETGIEGKYFSPHDANIGGCLCPACYESLNFEFSMAEAGQVLEAVCCDKVFYLKEENGYKLEII